MLLATHLTRFVCKFQFLRYHTPITVTVKEKTKIELMNSVIDSSFPPVEATNDTFNFPLSSSDHAYIDTIIEPNQSFIFNLSTSNTKKVFVRHWTYREKKYSIALNGTNDSSEQFFVANYTYYHLTKLLFLSISILVMHWLCAHHVKSSTKGTSIGQIIIQKWWVLWLTNQFRMKIKIYFCTLESIS